MNWLESKGLKPKQDAENTKKIVYLVTQNDLVIEAKTHVHALLLDDVSIKDYSKLRIEWGIHAFPSGASYEKGIRSEAIMVYVFLARSATRADRF
jgi:hypothetical protein